MLKIHPDWYPLIFIVMICGAFFGFIGWVAYDEHVSETSLSRHIEVAEFWERHPDIRPFIAQRMRDRVLSNADAQAIKELVIELHAQEYRDAIQIPVDAFPRSQEPMVDDAPDPTLQH